MTSDVQVVLTYCFKVAPFSATCRWLGNFIPGNCPQAKETYLFVILFKPAVVVAVAVKTKEPRIVMVTVRLASKMRLRVKSVVHFTCRI